MNLTPQKIHIFLFAKLPAAYWCGVRVRSITAQKCVTRVRYTWFNQNPFKSMFWAVQGMAAELSTGALVLQKIRASKHSISMLVLNNRANFSKKARGTITFTCLDGAKLDTIIEQVIATGVGQTISMQSIGKDETGAIVSTFTFEWTLKLKH